MDHQDNHDALDSILDSLTMDDTMERKIHEFSQNKQRSRRIQKARSESAQFQKTYSSTKKDNEEEIVLDQKDLSWTPDVDATQTFVSHPVNSGASAGMTASGTAANSDGRSSAVEATQTFTQSPQHTIIPGTLNRSDLEPALVHNEALHPSVHATIQAGSAADPGSQTMVFGNLDNAGSTLRDTTHSTVIMSEQELQNLQNDAAGTPLLKREYVADTYHPAPARKHFSWKIPLMLCTLVLAVILGFGAWRFVSGHMGNLFTPSTETSQNYYEQLLAWAQGYAGLSDSEKKEISSLERVYNRLNDAQRSEIDKILTSATGKTFNELLASMNSGEKEDSKNNNTEIAEQKAQLKNQIADLQAQLDSLTSSITASQADVDSAFAVLTDRTNAQEKARQAYEKAAARVDELNSSLQPLQQTAADLQNQLADAQSQLDALIAEQNAQQSPDDPNSPDSQIPEDNPSVQNARKQVENLQAQIAANEQAMQPVSAQVDSAVQEMNNAKAVLDNATAEAANAQSKYDTVKNAAGSAGTNAEIESLKNQIQSLQNELDNL